MQYHTVDLDQNLDKNPDLLETMGNLLVTGIATPNFQF